MSSVGASRRSTTICDQCRARKVRCDGNRNSCSNCERLGYACSFQSASSPRPGDSPTSLSLPKRRTREACTACHSLKARCSGERPQCHRCRRRGVDCKYARGRQASRFSPSIRLNGVSSPHELSPSSPSVTMDGPTSKPMQEDSSINQNQGGCRSPPSPKSIGLPSKKIVSQAIEDFFRHIHPLGCCAFLHKASIVQGYAVRRTDTAFLLSLCGLTYGILDSESASQRQAAEWINEAESRILDKLKTPSIFKVQATVLIVYYKLHIGQFSSAFMLLGIAARFAFALRLNYEDSSLCFLAQESRRRLMWAIHVLDTQISGGLKEFTVCPFETIAIQLPCREEDFELDNPQTTGSLKSISDLPSPSQIGLLTHYIRIMNIRDRILRYTKQVASGDSNGPDPSRSVRDFEFELQLFSTSLPPSLVFSLRNLRLRAYSRWLPRYVMVHVWWHQCHCDLYRLLFVGLREAVSNRALRRIDPDLIAYCQSRCVEHARAMATEIFATLIRLDVKTRVMDHAIQECAYQCARIIFHAYRTDAERFSLGGASAFTETAYCLGVLENLCANSPSANAIKKEIQDLIAGEYISESSDHEQDSPDPRREEGSTRPGNVGKSARSRQILSRHAVVKNAAFTDDSASVISPLETDLAAEPSNHRIPHVTSHDCKIVLTPTNRHFETPQVPSDPGSAGSIIPQDEHQHNILQSPLSTTDLQVPSAIEDLGLDYTLNDAYQGAWEIPQLFFDPLTKGAYSHADEGMDEFMQTNWIV